MTFEITDAAREDVAAAIRFYNSKPGRHGAAVRAEFNRAARAIASSPRMYSAVEDEYPGIEAREFLISRFEQRVIFVIEHDHVQIIAVVHASAREGSWHRRLGHGYPTPSLGRDAALRVLLPALEARGVYSRGRFGAWKYEVSNQDHSFVQGVELVNRWLAGEPEVTLGLSGAGDHDEALAERRAAGSPRADVRVPRAGVEEWGGATTVSKPQGCEVVVQAEAPVPAARVAASSPSISGAASL